MGFEQLDLRILIDLKNNNSKECFYIIKNNKEVIQKYLGDNSEQETVKSFVKKLNYVILQTNPPFNIIEEILHLPYFNRVYSEFLNSNILIEACKLGRKETLDWLLTFDINPHVRDSKGRTALMYASKNSNLLYVMKKLISPKKQLNIINNNNVDDDKSVNVNIWNESEDENDIVDNFDDSSLNDVDDQGKNVLFYALHNIPAIKELLKTNININHLNKNHETVLLYSCKNNIFESIQYLIQCPNLDVNLTDKRGWTAAMYLAAKGRKKELMSLNEQGHKCNYEYQNNHYESTLSIILKKMYWPEEFKELEEDNDREDFSISNLSLDTFSDNASSVFSEPSSYYNTSHSNNRDSVLSFYSKSSSSSFLPYIIILTRLINIGFNFNISMDGDGNTPLMLLIIVKDIHTLHYVLNTSKNYDLSLKNKYGENACSHSKYLH